MSTGIGAILRDTRLRAGVDLEDAAADTRIGEPHLVALEQEEFARIGGDVYVRGFLRSYARYLGLDPEPLVERYRQEHAEAGEPHRVASKPVEPAPVPRRPIAMIVAVLAVLVVAGLAVIGSLTGDEEDAGEPAAPDPVEQDPPSPDPAREPGPPSGDDAQPGGEGADDEASQGGQADAEETAPDTEADELMLTLSVSGGQAWARVTVDGQPVDEGLYAPGYSATYSGDEIVVRIGDAGAAAIEVNGSDLGPLGASGEVVNVVCTAATDGCEVVEDA